MPSTFSQRVRRTARSLWRRPVSRAAGQRLFRPELLCLEERALPSTLTVTNLNDSGPGSLRYELGQAQGGDTIAFAPDLHGTITLTSGELQVGQNVTIRGPGAGRLSVSGNHAARVFEVLGGADATISGLTITDGVANPAGSPIPIGLGGGILVDPGATLNLTGAVVTGNVANAASAAGGLFPFVVGDGGGIYNAGTLVLIADSITHNTANAGSAGPAVFGQANGVGGGVYNRGTLTATGTAIDDNTANAGAGPVAGGEGGGIYTSGTLDFFDVSVAQDTANAGPAAGDPAATASGTGGGLFIDAGTATVRHSFFVDDTANAAGASANTQSGSALVSGEGGGIYNNARLTVSGSLFTGDVANAASASAATMRAVGEGGAVFGNGGQLSIDASILLGNTANSGTATVIEASGGAILDQTALELSNSFVAFNTTNSASGAIEVIAQGGGIWTAGGTITHSSVAFNNVNTGLVHSVLFSEGGGVYDTGDLKVTASDVLFNNLSTNPDAPVGFSLDAATTGGGGIDVDGGAAQLTLNHSAVAGNFVLDTPSDIGVHNGGQVDPASAGNLIGTGGSGGLVTGVNGNIVL
jgi:hypothetical protein